MAPKKNLIIAEIAQIYETREEVVDKILAGKVVNLEAMKKWGMDVTEEIKYSKWKPCFTMKELVHPKLVRDFWNNASLFESKNELLKEIRGLVSSISTP